jgi:peptide/nickel transport system substrate-binding protein
MRHLPVAGVVLVTAFLAGGWLALSPAGQAPPRKPPIEEEDPTTPRKPRVHLPLEDEDQAFRLADLALEADQATQPAIRDLYRSLQTPADVVTWKDRHTMQVAPVSQYVGTSPDRAGRVNLQTYDEQGKRGGMHSVPLQEIERIDHFEDIALGRVEAFLGKDGQPSGGGPTRLEKLQAAEKALAAVLRFHDSGRREGPQWDDVKQRLRQKLFAVRLDHLRLLADQGDWDKAFELAVQLARETPDQAVHTQLARQLDRLVQQSLKEGKYAEARLRLKLLEERFPASAESGPASEALRRQAQELFDQARGREKADRAGAMELLSVAERIWPRLPGLHDYRLQLSNAFPVLGVGVRELPENLSPATAVTDSERQAVELLFESLLQPRDVPGVGQVYGPELADRPPGIIPRGRQFALVRDAYWSSGQRVTAADVRATIRLLRRPDWAGFRPDWPELVDEPPPGRHVFQVDVLLRQGFLRPEALMTFKVLPAGANLERPDAAEFGRQPVGSGPYVYRGRNGDAAVFAANPNYHRAGKPNQPYIREIHFFHSDDPAKDFQDGRLQVLLDLPTEATRPLQSLGTVRVETLRNRRVWFLAVNHRAPALKDQDLRKAIAYGIDRTKILDDVFRSHLKDAPDVPHRPLNGPYPPDSWACNPSLSKPDPFNPLLARGLADKVKARRPQVKLRLKYPDDEQARRACEALREQVTANTGVDLELIPRSPRELYQDVELQHDYDLAYYHYDYPDELYWLWALFNPDPRALEPGGGNYLGYENDSELESAFRAAMGHREFAKVRQLTRTIHAILFAKMPLIPLWQLDTHIALKGVTPVNLDPLLVFPDVGQWKRQQ